MARQRKKEASDVRVGPDDTEKSAIAKGAILPSLHGAATIKAYSKWLPPELGLKELVNAFTEQTNAVIDGDLDRAEAMLTVQAHTLDAIYNSLARKALNAELLSQFDAHLKLALRAQSQCRSTWEALSAIKNPVGRAYVGQANFAHNQQINNATNSSRTRENQNQPNELLENKEHEPDKWLDRGAPEEAIRADQDLETVEEVNGSTEPGR